MIPKKLQLIIDSLNNCLWIQKIYEYSDDINVYIVGGCVRDAFLNKSIKDVDIMIEGINLSDISNILKSYGKIDIVGESFSVIKFKPNGYIGEPYDIATPRIDKKIGKGHKGFEIITDGVDAISDLKRRDFTINSIAIELLSEKIVDPFNGLSDLKNKILKATDINAFTEDALRIIRGIQFASRFGFNIDTQTMNLMQENAYLVKEISGERIFEEFLKILNKEGNTQLALNLIHKTGIDKALFDKTMDVYDKGFEHLDTISFFYVLGLLGDVDPAEFLKKKLKGDNELVNNVRTLDKIFSLLFSTTDEEDLKFMLFKAFQVSPKVKDAVILPPEVDKIILQMRLSKIPMTYKDILISGEEIKLMSGYDEGPEIGFFKERLLRDALMNKFNWKSKEESLEHLNKILS